MRRMKLQSLRKSYIELKWNLTRPRHVDLTRKLKINGVAVACYDLRLSSVLSQQTVLEPTQVKSVLEPIQVKYALGPMPVLMRAGTNVLGSTF